MEQTVALAALGFLASKILELIKRLRGHDINGAVTLIAMWISGVATTALAAHAQLTQDVIIPGTTAALGHLEGWSQVFLGLVLSSVTAFTYDVKKAIDGTDSAAQPPLLPSGSTTPPQG